jgi:hypothetical protein
MRSPGHVPGQRREHVRGRPDDVFAVVDEQEGLGPGQGDAGRSDHVACLVPDAEPGCDEGVDVPVRCRRELDHPHVAVPEAGDLHGQPRLAAAARADQADQRAGRQHPRHLGKFVRPADEAGRRGGQDLLAGKLLSELDERGPVGEPELAQQGRDVALDGAHGYEHPSGDLAVRQPLADRRERLGLPRRDTGRIQPGLPC